MNDDRKLLRTALVASLFWGSAFSMTVFAQDDQQIGDCSGGSCAAADAVAQAQGLGQGNAQAIGGSAQSALINETIANSSQNAVNEVNIVTRDSIPPPPSGMWQAVPIPQIFSSPTVPSSAKGIPLTLAYFNECAPDMSGYVPDEIRGRGASRNTDVVFLPHRNLRDMATEGEVVGQVEVMFPEEANKVNCLGIINVSARKKRADRVQFFGLVNDGQLFLKENVSGFSDVSMLCAKNAIGANIGMDSKGIGGAISPGLSDPSGSGTLTTLLGGLSGQAARTFPNAQLGLTCLVVSTDDGGTEVDISALNQDFGPLTVR